MEVFMTATETTTAVDFIYFFDEVIPELFQTWCVAERRVRKPCLCNERLKLIKCPHCKERLTDVPLSTKVELYKNPYKAKNPCHSYATCRSCKSVIGMMLKVGA
jgi:hypothetical protein